jgi:hypothetical protein
MSSSSHNSKEDYKFSDNQTPPSGDASLPLIISRFDSLTTFKEGLYMKQSVRKFISTTLSISTAFGISTIGLGTAFAGQLTHNSVTLSDNRVQISSSYSFSFVVPTAGAIKSMSFQFSTTPSGSVTVPSDLDTSSTSNYTITSVADGGTPGTFTKTTPSTNGLLQITSGSGLTAASGDTITAVFGGIKNNDLLSHCDGLNSNTVDTCYIRIQTYSDAAYSSPVDLGVVSYTVVTAISATATVDPILTFQVYGVAGHTTNGLIVSNDANAADTGGPTTTAVDSTPTTIPFSNVGVNTAKVAQQQLAVQTNANNGYFVYARLLGSAVGGGSGSSLMAGSQGSNKIDPFTGTGATWSAPQVFIAPTSTTTNTNTGWVGMRTNNGVVNAGSGVGGFNTINYFSPPAVGTGGATTIGNAVMSDSGPDNGTAKTSITYKIAVNAYEPADSYSGVVVYSAVPSY